MKTQRATKSKTPNGYTRTHNAKPEHFSIPGALGAYVSDGNQLTVYGHDESEAGAAKGATLWISFSEDETARLRALLAGEYREALVSVLRRVSAVQRHAGAAQWAQLCEAVRDARALLGDAE